jgi:hypothetical protein
MCHNHFDLDPSHKWLRELITNNVMNAQKLRYQSNSMLYSEFKSKKYASELTLA